MDDEDVKDLRTWLVILFVVLPLCSIAYLAIPRNTNPDLGTDLLFPDGKVISRDENRDKCLHGEGELCRRVDSVIQDKGERVYEVSCRYVIQDFVIIDNVYDLQECKVCLDSICEVIDDSNIKDWRP